MIYQPESEFSLLAPELQYRHVRFDEPGGPKDFSFEREWRFPGEELALDPKTCTLIVPHREWDYKLRTEHYSRDMEMARVMGRSPFERISNYDWHILALGDLWASFPINDDAP